MENQILQKKDLYVVPSGLSMIFIKDLWHPANKIPKKFNHYGFAVLYILQYNHQIRMVLYDKDNMSWKNVINSNEYWLYVDDLLPKKGGEQ